MRRIPNSVPARQRGFTLIEVMVALVIAALGLAAIGVTANGSISNSFVFRERAFALYVGMNVITELRLSDEFPDPRDFTDDVEMADRTWVWTARVSETEVETLRRVEVDVALADEPERIVRTIVGFVGQPSPAPGANSIWQGLTGATN